MSNALAALTLAVVFTQAPVATTSEIGLRSMVLTPVLPSYPAGSVQAGASGVAVAEIVATATGGVQSVEILEAPDAAIGQAVRAALNQWTFPASSFAKQAKITFYFTIEKGRGRVLHPQDMPGGPAIERRVPANYSPQNPPPVVKPAPQAAPLRTLEEANTTSISVQELQQLTGAIRPTIVDVGNRASFKRGHLDGAINIPYDELDVRSRIELRGRGRIVIDCTQEQTFHCLFADHVLKDAGFKDVAILRR